MGATDTQTTTHNKLVRDRIPGIIIADGCECVSRSLDHEDYRRELFQKLCEESKEAADASDEIALIEELADILEVLYALASSCGRSMSDLETVRLAKRAVRGGFEDRVFLQTVTKRVGS